MGRKLRADQYGVFPGNPEMRYQERQRVLNRELARRAGLPSPESLAYENLGNRSLPVYEKKSAIQKAIRDHQISMVEGATGSGKSTQIAQYALEMGYKKIVYLEPRVLLADNLSDQIARELAEQLGEEQVTPLVGVRHSERSNGRNAPIEIMTPATFMRVMDELEQFANEPILILGDEIHEKDFETELAVAASVQHLTNHNKWRMVLASATLDAESIHEAYSEMNGRPIPRTLVEGRPHELQIVDEPDLTAIEAYKKYGAEHEKTMIFTAGKTEIKDISNKLRKEKLGKVRINKLHAKLSRADIKQATHARLGEGERQVIVSTSAGQSGITIAGLTLVISDGTTRRPDLDADGVPGLFKQYCAQDELIQQGGRAGRDVAGGIVVRVRPDDLHFEYKSMEERAVQAPAQIYHTNISRNVLLTASFGKDFYDLNKFLIHKVNQRTILESYEVLYRLGALDEFNEITELGQLMNKFPLRPEFARVVAEAVRLEASSELMQHLVGIVSAVESGGLPYFEKGVSMNWRKDIRHETTDDYLAQLDMFYATRQFYGDGEVDEKALEERNYDTKNTYRAHKTFDKICHVLQLSRTDVDTTPPTPEQVEVLHEYLIAGLFDFAHTKVSRQGRTPEYVSVHDQHEPMMRRLSDRGTYKAKESDAVVIGMPRRFEKHVKGELTEFSVIENVMPTSLRKLARHVLHLTERKPVTTSTVIGGHLKRTDELHFGSVKIAEVPSVSRLTHTKETKQQLRDAAHNKPTQTLEELIAIKKKLERLVRKTPSEEMARYFPEGILTDEWLHGVIETAIDNEVDNIYALDNKLRSIVVHGNLSIRSWLSEEAERDLMDRSPDMVELSGSVAYQLYYSHGQPLINGFNLRDADHLPDDGLYLKDGREVLISYRFDSDTKRHSAGVLKKYAAQFDSPV
ncbi:MAG: helicase-related protein [Candidatus Saccharimonadales bacterium]